MEDRIGGIARVPVAGSLSRRQALRTSDGASDASVRRSTPLPRPGPARSTCRRALWFTTAPTPSRSLVVGLAWVFAVACDAGSDPVQPPAATLAAIEVTPTGPLTLTSLGMTSTLTATARDVEGRSVRNVAFSWTSDAPSVASVDSDGVVRALNEGSATISASFQGITSNPVTANVSVASRLSFTVQPSNVMTDASITPAVEVTVFDGLGRAAHAFAADIAISITTNPGGATLAGAAKTSAVSGVARFTDLSLDRPGSGYRLTAAAAGLQSATSAGFSVSPGSSGQGQISYVTGGNLYLMNADGSGVTPVTDFPPPPNGYSREAIFGPYDWSPSGDRVVAVTSIGCFCGDRFQLVVFGVDGSRETLAENGGYAPWFAPVWSPDGAKIAYGDTGDIYVMDVDGSNTSNLTNSFPTYSSMSPAWSPDGTKIAYTSASSSLGVEGIFIMNADGSSPMKISDDIFFADPAWSPDGSRIAFLQAPDNSSLDKDVWIMNADGSGRMPLVVDGARSADPSWSRDGSTILFATNRDPNEPDKDDFRIPSQLWTVGSDGTGLTQVTSGPARISPRWRPGS